jgi:hypothetical protein
MADKDRVVLSVPARGEYARTVRLAAAELAARTGMTIDDADDVKLAVEEAFVFACARDGVPRACSRSSTRTVRDRRRRRAGVALRTLHPRVGV